MVQQNYHRPHRYADVVKCGYERQNRQRGTTFTLTYVEQNQRPNTPPRYQIFFTSRMPHWPLPHGCLCAGELAGLCD